MKKNLRNKLILPVLLIAFIVAESSCTRRKLESPSGMGTVNITFDWLHLSAGETIPPGMKLCFYNSNGSVITKDCSGTGFSGALPAGTYQVLAYNTDAGGVAYRNLDKYTEAQVYTPSYTKATYISQPLHVYGIGLGSLSVLSDEKVSKVMTPAAFVKKAVIELIVTGQRSAVASTRLTLDGIVQAVNIADGTFPGGAGSLSFVPDATATGFESTVTFFGKDPATANLLTIVVYFTGGGSQIFNIDLTPKLTGVIPINMDITVNIAITGSVTGGFQATLSDWSVKNRDVTINP